MVSLEYGDNFFHNAYTSSLTLFSGARGALINFDSAVTSFELLAYRDRFQTTIMDRSVLLSFSLSQIRDVQLLQAVVTLDSGLTGFVSFPVELREVSSFAYEISASAVSTVAFPTSQLLSVNDTFVLKLKRTVSAVGWQQLFDCRYVTDDFSINLIRSVPSDIECNFAFDEFPLEPGRIELYSNNVLAWSFAVEFT